MEHFLDTMESIPAGYGFLLFGKIHLMWLGVFAVFAIGCCLLYCKLSESYRKYWKAAFAALLMANELFKVILLLIGGNFRWTYLPLHLCSINVFCILWHVWRPSAWMDNFLYMVCVPGAVAALLFPAWNTLPIMNGMHIHSFLAHIMLATYPIVLTISGEIQPDVKKIPACLGMLVGMAIPIYVLNRLLGTNFMFLMYAEPGNPLYLFERWFGSHLWGFPVITAGVLLVMYVPVVLLNKGRKT